ncbi:hypothetical protein RWA05_30580 (plasmid) [Sinorhizobium meliloti]|jgi:hypothetical protein|uniref:hypothetical protein n=1 Tax=Rhizobium meliloti TaxID=382 RepID=UPI00299D819F|nr:hypothetical protein [Sinorhizobium meliloti]
MIDQLRSIGIEKGKPFAPNEKTQAILKEAGVEAHALVDEKYEASFSPTSPASAGDCRFRWK